MGSTLVRLKDESQWVKIPEHHPGIISKELFNKAQGAIRRVKSPKKHVHLYPLRDKVYCGNCLHRMSRIGNVTFRFICSHTQADENAPCHGLKVEETELESVIYAILNKQAQIILGAADVDSVGSAGALSTEHAEYSKQISGIQEQKRVLFERLILHELSEQEYREKKTALDAELARLQETRAVLSTQLSQQQASKQTKSVNEKLAQEVMGVERLSSDLVATLIDRVYVYPRQRIEIVWKVVDFGGSEENIQKNF